MNWRRAWLPLILVPLLTGSGGGTVTLRLVDEAGQPLEGTVVAAETIATTDSEGTVSLPPADGYWVKLPMAPPVLTRPGEDGVLEVPGWPRVSLTILEAGSARVLKEGTLRWQVAGAPVELTVEAWQASDGTLHLVCPDGCGFRITVPGHRATTLRPRWGQAGLVVKLARERKVRLTVDPEDAAGEVFVAPDAALGLLTTFGEAASKHTLKPGRPLDLELEAGRIYRGLLRVPGRAPLPFEIGPEATSLQLHPETGIPLHGTVVTEQGEPLAGATVEVHGAVPARDMMPYTQQARTAEDGSFLVEGLLPGPVTVRARAPGRAAAVRELEAGKTEGLEIELAPGLDLVVHVADQTGAPVEKVILEWKGLEFHGDRGGTVRIPGVRPGADLDVKVTGPGVVPAHRVIHAEGPEVTLTVVRGARLVWPLDADHPELLPEGTYLWTQLVQGRRPGREGTARWDATRRAVVAEGLPGGTYRLEARIPGYAPLLSEPLSVDPGEETRFALGLPDPGLVLEGVVIDAATGDPVGGAELRAEPGDGATFRTPRDLQTGAHATADAEGRFRLPGLESRSYTIRVSAPGFAERILHDVTPDEGSTVSGIEVALRPPAGASVELRLVPETGSAAGAPAMLLGAAPETAFADTTGVVTWTDVRPGRYVACARAYGGPLGCTPPFGLAEEESREMVLRTGAGGFVRVPGGGIGTVHVALADGTSLDTLLVLTGAVRQDGDGVLIGPLDEGVYLVVHPSTGVPATVEVTGGETRALDR